MQGGGYPTVHLVQRFSSLGFKPLLTLLCKDVCNSPFTVCVCRREGVCVVCVTTHPLHYPLCRNHLNRNDTVGDILFATVLSCLCPPMTSSFLRLLLQHRATRTSPRLHHQQMLPASWKEICGNAPPPLLGKLEGSCETYRCMYPVLMECLLLLRQSA